MTATPYIKSVDTRGLTALLQTVASIFYARGATPNMVQRFVKTEAASLAGEIAHQIGPAGVEEMMPGIKWDVKKILNRAFSDRNNSPNYSNLSETQQESSIADFTWLAAGPNFLLGINDEDLQLQAGTQAAYEMFRAGQAAGGRGDAYVLLGKQKRTGQNIFRLNRTRVSIAAFNGVLAKVKKTVGEAKSVFVSTCYKLGGKRRFPGWVTDKIEQAEEKDKVIFDEAGLKNAANPSITFGGDAPGFETNPSIRKAMDGAVKFREYQMTPRLEKMIRGAVMKINTGQVYFSKGELGEDEI